MQNGTQFDLVNGSLLLASRKKSAGSLPLTKPLLGAFLMAICVTSATAAEGTIEFFNESGGYGYVTDNDTDETYIFETADTNGVTVNEGDAVTFSVTTADDRFSVKAEGIALAGSAPEAMTAAADDSADDAAADDAAADDAAADDAAADDAAADDAAADDAAADDAAADDAAADDAAADDAAADDAAADDAAADDAADAVDDGSE
jgi:cold shock CspA family protein